MRFNPNQGRCIPGAMYEENFLKKYHIGPGMLNLTNGQNSANIAQYNSGFSVAPSFTMQRNGILYATNNISQYPITDLGLSIERGAYNACLYSRDLTNAAWVKVVTPTVAKDQVGNDTISVAAGTHSASSFTATANGDTVLQTITLTSRPVIFSAYIKRLIGTGTISITQDGTNWTDVTSQVAATSGYAWVQIPMATIANPIVGFQLGTSGDSIAIDLCQCEYITAVISGFSALQTGSKATSPIYNATNVVNYRANANAFFQNAAAIGSIWSAGATLLNDLFSANAEYSVVASWNGDVTTGGSANSGPLFLASDMTCPTSIGGGASGGFGTTGAATTANSGTNGRGNWNCAAFSMDGASGVRVCLNGGLVAGPQSTSGWIPSSNPGCTHFNMFNNGTGTVNGPLNGFVGGWSFIRRRLQDMEMQYYTDPTVGYFTTYN